MILLALTAGLTGAASDDDTSGRRRVVLHEINYADQPGVRPVPPEAANPTSVPSNGVPNWVSAAAVGTGVALLSASMWRAARWLVVAPLYSKIADDRLLDHRVRRQIHEFLAQNPGATTQELRRELDLAWGSAVHHLRMLERAGLVASVQWGGNRDWYLSIGWPLARRKATSALKRPKARRVFEAITQSPGASLSELARRLGVHHTTVLFHLRRLQAADLVRSEKEGAAHRYFATSAPSLSSLAP